MSCCAKISPNRQEPGDQLAVSVRYNSSKPLQTWGSCNMSVLGVQSKSAEEEQEGRAHPVQKEHKSSVLPALAGGDCLGPVYLAVLKLSWPGYRHFAG